MKNNNSTFGNLKYKYRFFFILDDLLKKIGINFTKAYIYSFKLDDFVYKEPKTDDVVIKECDMEDLDLFGNLKDLFLKDMQEGHVLIAAFLDDHWVGYNWLSSNPVEMGEIPRFLHSKGAYMYRIFIKEECRQRGIAKKIIHFSLNLIKNKYKKNKAYVIIEASNIPSINIYERIGFYKIGTIKYSRFFLWEKYEEKISDDTVTLFEN